MKRPVQREATPDIQLVRTMRFGVSQHGRVAIELNGQAYEFTDVRLAEGFIEGIERQITQVKEGGS